MRAKSAKENKSKDYTKYRGLKHNNRGTYLTDEVAEVGASGEVEDGGEDDDDDPGDGCWWW